MAQHAQHAARLNDTSVRKNQRVSYQARSPVRSSSSTTRSLLLHVHWLLLLVSAIPLWTAISAGSDILLEEGNIHLDLVEVLEEVGMIVGGIEDRRRRNLYST